MHECSHNLRPRMHGPGSSVPPASPTMWSKFSPTLYASQDSEGLEETTRRHTFTRNFYSKGWQMYTLYVTMETNPQSAVRPEAACSPLEGPSCSCVRWHTHCWGLARRGRWSSHLFGSKDVKYLRVCVNIRSCPSTIVRTEYILVTVRKFFLRKDDILCQGFLTFLFMYSLNKQDMMC